MTKLPDHPDTTHYASYAGESIKLHSRDQIIEYGNARAIEAVTQAFERAARNTAPDAPPLEVVVERGRVWLRRAHQSFMLAYDSKEPLEQRLRHAPRRARDRRPVRAANHASPGVTAGRPYR